MSSLLLYFDPTLASNEITWQLIAGSPHDATETGTLKELGQRLKDTALQDCKVILPGELTYCCQIELPSRASTKALPFLIEEYLAAPLETLHIANKMRAAKSHTLCAIDKSVLTHYLNKLTEINLHPSVITLDHQLIPQNDDVLNYAVINNRAIVRDSDGSGFCVDKQCLDHLNVTSNTSAETELNYAVLFDNLKNDKKSLNLLQGEYQKYIPKAAAQRWQKITAITIASSLMIMLTYLIGMGWYMNDKAGHLALKSKQSFQELVPQAKRFNNIRRQMQGLLNNSAIAMSNNNDFLPLLLHSAEVIKNNRLLKIRSIRYNQQQGVLQLELQSNNLETVNQLQSKFQQQHLKAEIQSANSNEAGILTRISIGAGQ